MQVNGNVKIIILGIASSLLTFGSAQEEIAWIYDKTNDVKVIRKSADQGGQTEVEAEIEMALYAGDIVQTGAKSTARVWYRYGQKRRLMENETHTIELSAEDDSFFAQLSEWIFGSRAKKVPGSRRGGDAPLVLYVRGGKIFESRPAFSWFSPGENVEYQLRLVKASGEACHEEDFTLWQLTTRDTVLKYPSEKEPLQTAAKYWAELRWISRGSIDFSNCFEVVPEDEKQKVEEKLAEIHKEYASHDPQDVTEAIISSAFLIKEEYYTLAFRKLRKALALRPEHPLLQSLFRELCAAVELPDLIHAEKEDAK